MWHGLPTSSVSPQHSMTPKPPSSAALVLLAMNYIQARSCQRHFFFRFNPYFSPVVHPSLAFSQASQILLRHPSHEAQLSARYAHTAPTQSYCLSTAPH